MCIITGRFVLDNMSKVSLMQKKAGSPETFIPKNPQGQDFYFASKPMSSST